MLDLWPSLQLEGWEIDQIVIYASFLRCHFINLNGVSMVYGFMPLAICGVISLLDFYLYFSDLEPILLLNSMKQQLP